MRRKYYRSRVAGGLIVRETTNIGNGWHPHLHNIVDGDYIPAKKLESDLAKALGWPVRVNIRQGDKEGILAYALKYLKKAPDIFRVDGGKDTFHQYCSGSEAQEREREYNQAMRGIRTVQGFGSFYGKGKEEKRVLTCPFCGESDWLTEKGLQRMIELGDRVVIRPVDEHERPCALGNIWSG